MSPFAKLFGCPAPAQCVCPLPPTLSEQLHDAALEVVSSLPFQVVFGWIILSLILALAIEGSRDRLLNTLRQAYLLAAAFARLVTTEAFENSCIIAAAAMATLTNTAETSKPVQNLLRGLRRRMPNIPPLLPHLRLKPDEQSLKAQMAALKIHICGKMREFKMSTATVQELWPFKGVPTQIAGQSQKKSLQDVRIEGEGNSTERMQAVFPGEKEYVYVQKKTVKRS